MQILGRFREQITFEYHLTRILSFVFFFFLVLKVEDFMLIIVKMSKDHYEEVDIITKGGNYGWSVFEGPFPYNPHQSQANYINPIFPVLGYNHSDVNDNEGSAAISGGYFYRSLTDPCMFGRWVI